jgi:hypothetical protein
MRLIPLTQAHLYVVGAALLGIPLLADFLEEALSEFGISFEEFEMGHL